MSRYTYILAPHTPHNFYVLQEALDMFTKISEEQRVRAVYAKSPDDVVDDEGGLLVPASTSQYIYMRAVTDEIPPELLAQVENVAIFSQDNQPKSEYWI